MSQYKMLIAVVTFLLAFGAGCQESTSVPKNNTARNVISQTLNDKLNDGVKQTPNSETNAAPQATLVPVEASVAKDFSRNVPETEEGKNGTSGTFFHGQKINWGERTKTANEADEELSKPVNPADGTALTKTASVQEETVPPKQDEHPEAENAGKVEKNTTDVENTSKPADVKTDMVETSPGVFQNNHSETQHPENADIKADAKPVHVEPGQVETHESNPFALTDDAFLRSEPDVKPLPPVNVEPANVEMEKKSHLDESVWEKQPEPDLSTLEYMEIKPLKTEPINPSTPGFYNGPKTIMDSMPGMKPEDTKRGESKPENSNVENSAIIETKPREVQPPQEETIEKHETTKTDSVSTQEVLPDTVNTPSPTPVPASELLNPESSNQEPQTPESPLPEKAEMPDKTEKSNIAPQQADEHSPVVIDLNKPVHATVQNQDDPFAIGEAKMAEARKANEQKSPAGDAAKSDTANNNGMKSPQQASKVESNDIFSDETLTQQDVKKKPDVPAEGTQPKTTQTLKQADVGTASTPETTPTPETTKPDTTSKSHQETKGTGDSTNHAKPDDVQPKKQTGSKEQLEIPPLERLSPVEAFLVNEARRSPVRLMESVELLFQLNRPELARPLMRQLIDKEMTPEDYSQLARRINPATLMHLTSDEAYQPEGAAIARKITAGAKAYFESRNQIEKAMQQLLHGTDLEKEDAIRSILGGQEMAIEFLMERLAVSNDPQEVAESQALLYTLGEDARRALQETVPNPNQKLAMRAAAVMTRLGKKSDAQFLFPMLFDASLSDSDRRQVVTMVQLLRGDVPSKTDAAAILHATATNYFRERVPFRLNEDNLVRIWMIPDGGSTPKYVAVTEQDASKFYAEKFARFALQIAPQNNDYRQLWIVACFDLIGNKIGSDNPVKIDPSLIDSVKNNYTELEIENALNMAMQHDRPMAARVAVELLGHIGTAETLIYQRGSQSALVRAAGFSDRRVRFAALASIMKLDPQRQYPGSSVVSESLVFFTRGTGVKRAIVAAPWIGDAKKIAGLLEQKALGYKPVVATGGRQAMQLAIDSADTELMMLDARTPNPDVGFLIQDMRADNRTHNVPVGIMAAAGEITRAERVTFGNRMSRACLKPIDEEMAKFIVDNLLRETGVEQVPPDIRLAEAKQSILWVAQLYERSSIYRFENIEQIAYNTLWDPELASETLQLVRLIPTQRAQIMLSQMVSATAMPIEIRRQALEAFRFHAQRHGVLIRGRLILDLYDAYNNSAGEPLASQQVRSSLLDSIEQYANYMQNIGRNK